MKYSYVLILPEIHDLIYNFVYLYNLNQINLIIVKVNLIE